MVHDWLAHQDNGADAVMGAVRRADAADLNRRAHHRLEAGGQLGPLVALVDDRRFCLDEQVLAERNRYDLGLINGDLGVITGIVAHHPAIRVRIGDRDLEVPMDYVTDHLSHAYARTVHKTQGLTCDVALLLGDDSLYAELGYTGLTRGRQRNHLYAVTSSLDIGEDGSHDLAHVIAALDTSRAKTAAIDIRDAPEIA
jgi:ATP-dependent exoDNAse (exonuclease V) alpha subunit